MRSHVDMRVCVSHWLANLRRSALRSRGSGWTVWWKQSAQCPVPPLINTVVSVSTVAVVSTVCIVTIDRYALNVVYHL